MINKYLLFIFILFFSFHSYEQDETLFRIIDDGKIGYINRKGEVVISPRFAVGSEFAEGVATVKEKYSYGFIDKTGKYIIPPRYDLATRFFHGVAEVTNDNKSYYINKSGYLLKNDDINVNLSLPEYSIYVIVGKNGKSGVWDSKTNTLVLDTIYDGIPYFSYKNDIFIVYNIGDELVDGYLNSYNYSIIDSTGKTVIPFNQFCYIHPFKNGVAIAENSNCDTSFSNYSAVIDSLGNLLFQINFAKNENFSGNFYNGLASINLSNKRKSATEKIIDDETKNTHQGFINLQGELVLNDTTVATTTDFSQRRAFIKRQDDKYLLINTKMERIGKHAFDAIKNGQFENGYLPVKVNSKWGIIDTSGVFVVSPKYTAVKTLQGLQNFFFYANKGSGYKMFSDDTTAYGIANYKGEEITQPLYKNILYAPDHLVSVEMNHKRTYIDTTGKIIWQESGDTVLIDFNLDFQMFSSFYIPKEATTIPANEQLYANDYLSFIVDTTNTDTLSYSSIRLPHQYLFYKVLLANSTDKNIEIWNADGRLMMTTQAKNKVGKWQDIEFFREVRCGNSYHTATLKSNTIWDFHVPKYTGSFKTKLRIKLKYVETADSTGSHFSPNGITIYSNEFQGSINPSQFWNKLHFSRFFNIDDIRDP